LARYGSASLGQASRDRLSARDQQVPLGALCRRGAGPVGHPQALVRDAIDIEIARDRPLAEAGKAKSENAISTVESADDRRASHIGARQLQIDFEVVVRIDHPGIADLHRDFVAVGGVAVEVTCNGDRLVQVPLPNWIRRKGEQVPLEEFEPPAMLPLSDILAIDEAQTEFEAEDLAVSTGATARQTR
jgi:hypothetical protein